MGVGRTESVNMRTGDDVGKVAMNRETVGSYKAITRVWMCGYGGSAVRGEGCVGYK